MDTNSYIAFLVMGVILVAIDGQIIYRSGRKYLERSYGDSGSGTSMARLVTVLFHLVVVGLLMLVSTVDVGENQTEGVILRLGIVLLLLAAAHGVTIAILARIKEHQIQEQLAEEMTHPHSPIRGEQPPEPSIDTTPTTAPTTRTNPPPPYLAP
ncbi:hypothetical protein [Kibdelosporangium phytohabitans]|uniref:Uncharacterized protein n=1 Tax=Kibdelosporangium phytohabitans TaxID=860235 RepID=A0A0N7F5I9_9PSEU|nr:hypothetical protein [Kibdelosporangium phytohabitans]ALG14359.1 hypothetical protein AOZ06_52520 [Kibdelosporangium phytohabitans]MBE1466609.1 hypothetical protein [Kibdelosporangium phytohabitans]